MAWKSNSAGEVINRFPVCAAWYMVCAKVMGYDTDIAKSLGVARAKFFAAAKNGFKKGGSGKKAKSGGVPTETAETTKKDTIQFAGLEVYIEATSGKAIFGGKEVNPDDYNTSVMDKFVAKVGAAGYKHLIDEMTALAMKHTPAELNTGLAYQLYVSIRDEFRKWDFYADEDIRQSA